MDDQKKNLFRLPPLTAMLLLLFLCFNILIIGRQDVHASSVTVDFTDKSGNYIIVEKKKSGNVYTLYNQKQQPLTGLQYLRIPFIENEINSGYYMFDEHGVLIRKRNVYKIVKTKVNGVLFHGYYYANKNGKFLSSEYGLFYLNKLTCNGHTFTGYYYLQKYGKLNAAAQCRYMLAQKVNGMSFDEGYYWFSSSGKLCTIPAFQEIHARIHSVNFNGTFYFGGKNGMLELNKGGLKVINGKTYYLSKWARRAENAWAGGHYFLADGTMAVDMKTPDGFYVDELGSKVSASEYTKMRALKGKVESIIKGYAGTWSVLVKNLNTGSSFVINDCSHYAASTIKPFVMEATFNLINQKKLSYNAEIKEWMWYMITESDNICTNSLIRHNSPTHDFLKGAAVINAYLSANGYQTARVHHMLQSPETFITDGGTNQMTVIDAGRLLERIYKGTCVNKTYSKEMLRLLLNQKRRGKIPAGLPSGTRVANKTGETDSTQHDIAIVYGPKATYILCVLSTNSTEYYGIRGIQDISSAVYQGLNS